MLIFFILTMTANPKERAVYWGQGRLLALFSAGVRCDACVISLSPTCMGPCVQDTGTLHRHTGTPATRITDTRTCAVDGSVGGPNDFSIAWLFFVAFRSSGTRSLYATPPSLPPPLPPPEF